MLINFETMKNEKPRFIGGEYYWKQTDTILKQNSYDEKALEVVLPDMIVKDEIIDVLNEFKKEVEKNYEKVEVWYVIAK